MKKHVVTPTDVAHLLNLLLDGEERKIGDDDRRVQVLSIDPEHFVIDVLNIHDSGDIDHPRYSRNATFKITIEEI